MQPILVSYKAPVRSNLQKNTGPVGAMALTGPVVIVSINYHSMILENLVFVCIVT